MSCFDISAVYRYCNCGAVLPGPDKHSRPHLPKTTAIFKAYTATYKKFCHCIIFPSTTTIKNQENIMFEEGFCHFLFLPSIFGLNITQIFEIKLDLYHLLLTATFIATNFSAQIFFYTACFELLSDGYGHLATLLRCASANCFGANQHRWASITVNVSIRCFYRL